MGMMRSERTKRVLRLSLYVLLLHGLAAAWLAVQASAAVDQALLHAGGWLMQYAQATHQQEPRAITLNGAHAKLSVGATHASVMQVLDDFAAACRARSGQLSEQVREAARQASTTGGQADDRGLADWDGVVRVQETARGVLACLDLGATRLSVAELAQRAATFSRTGDLAALGPLRWVSAERGEARTVFVTLATEGQVNIGSMFPREGDVPGQDFDGVPRPAQSRRVLSAWEDGQGKAINAYRLRSADLEVIERSYRAQLADAGYTSTPASSDTKSSAGRGFIASHGDTWISVALSPAEENASLMTISLLNHATFASRPR